MADLTPEQEAGTRSWPLLPPQLNDICCWNCIYWRRKAAHIGECTNVLNLAIWTADAQRLTTDMTKCGAFLCDKPTDIDKVRGHREPKI